MAENSKIEWCDHTFNPWRGCTKVSDGCKNCYALDMSKRFGGKHGVWGPNGTRVVASESKWREPYRWNADAERDGVRKRVFCASMSDVFEGPETMPKESWPVVSEARERLGHLIDGTPMLDWLLLTKRPENATKYGPMGMRWERDGFPPNVWLGTSVEDQETANDRIGDLLRHRCGVHFLSCEPMLDTIDLTRFLFAACTHCDGEGFQVHRETGEDRTCPSCKGVGYWTDIPANELRGHTVDWVICGGESGPKARPMNALWAQSLRAQCHRANVAFFMKQGSSANWPAYKDFESFPEELQVREYPEVANV